MDAKEIADTFITSTIALSQKIKKGKWR